MPDIKGVCPIIATPFTESGEVDYDSMRELMRVLVAGGCHGLTLFGIAGEYYKLSEDECKEMVALVVSECQKGGVPSIISVTQHATELAVKQAQRIEQAGADCLMLLPPFFLKPSAADLYNHMKTIGRAVKIPIMVQYAPEQTGVSIPPEVFERLSKEVENIIYYKVESKPPGSYISRLLDLTQNRARVFVGNAGFQLPEALDRGAVGVMPGCSMFDVYLQIYDYHSQGERESSARIHNTVLPMLNHIRQNVEMIIAYEKKILRKRGFIETDYCRHPTFTPDQVHDELFEEYYEQLKPHFTFVEATR